MGKSVLVFVSHSSEDKESIIEPLVEDLENCYINVWLDKRKIVPGDNLRKSIFKDGLDKADIALIFFTEKSLQSAWVDREIKHVLREETKKGNNFDLNKIISIFDSEDTYRQIAERYPELTDDLLHLMPVNYTKVQLGQLVSAIWSKYLSLQGGDVETQRQLLEKEKEIFQKEKEIEGYKTVVEKLKSNQKDASKNIEFEKYLKTGVLDDFIAKKDEPLKNNYMRKDYIKNMAECMAFGLFDYYTGQDVKLSTKGIEFYKWYIIENTKE
jgi:hypothetical protein